MLAAFYHPPSFHKLHSVKSRTTLIKEIDYVGIALWTVGVVLFLLGISWGGGEFPWKSAAVICTLVIGFIGIILFFLWGGCSHPCISPVANANHGSEANAKLQSPLLPWAFFVVNPRGFLFPLISGTIAGMFYYGLTIIWPLRELHDPLSIAPF